LKISKRLEEIAATLPDRGVIADIGCDHGKLAVFLCETGKYEKIIAADISADSLQKAVELSRLRGAAMEFRVGSGLSVLGEKEADAAVMAGWGGLNIHEAIQSQMERARETLLVLQPMSHADSLRTNLARLGFGIVQESLVMEQGRLYEIMAVRYGVRNDCPGHILGLGPLLYAQKHPLFRVKVERLLKANCSEREKIGDADTQKAKRSLLELQKRYETLREVEQWLDAK